MSSTLLRLAALSSMHGDAYRTAGGARVTQVADTLEADGVENDFLEEANFSKSGNDDDGFPYKEDKAVDFVWINQALDCNVNCIRQWSCPNCHRVAGISDIQVVEGKVTQTLGIVAKWNDACLVAFRGTKNQANWDLNYQVMLEFHWTFTGCVGCRVHMGFRKIWKELRSGMINALDALKCKDKEIHMTGHSMGGAVASVASWELLHDGYNLEMLYTMGEAPSGDGPWARSRQTRYRKKGVKYFRITNYKDEVPLMHRAKMNVAERAILPYTHAGPEVYYSATELGKYKICKNGDDKTCQLQWCPLGVGCDKDVGRKEACDHCSYLGLDPCGTGATHAKCRAP